VYQNVDYCYAVIRAAARGGDIITKAVFVALLGFTVLLGCEAEGRSAIVESDASPVTSGSQVREAQHPLGAHLEEQYRGGLESVLERRYLRVLTSRSSFDYFLHQGGVGGFQYEMVRAFVQHLNRKYKQGRNELDIQFELLPVSSDQLIPQLLEGRGDMIAARLTITPSRENRVRFSIPYRKVDEVVVTSLDPLPFQELEDLAGFRFAVRETSSYHDSLLAFNRRLTEKGLAPVEILIVPEAIETEAILQRLALGEYEFTVVDSLLSESAAAVFEGLVPLPLLKLREGGELAWATDPRHELLMREIDTFLPQYREGSLLGNMAKRAYFEIHEDLRLRLIQQAPKELSPYDSLFRKYAEKFAFDWRLLAAVAYQESKFDQKTRNRSGATGIFQIKPMTAQEKYIAIPEISGPLNVENNIHAGVKYLAWIKGRYFEVVDEMSESNRIRMMLAAYNAGPARLIKARAHAAKMGLDPNRWFRNVELALLDMKKREPVKYVSEVNKRYVSYLLLGVDE